MSTKVSSWVWHEITEPLVGNELVLMLALADVADDSGRCIYVASESGLTYDALAEKVRVDRRTIERLIPRLRGRGLIDAVKGVKGRPNEFRILVPWAHVSTDNMSGNDSETVADSPTAVQDSPTTDAVFPDTAGSRSSYRRERKNNVVAAERGTRLPQPFEVTPEMVLWAREHAPLVNGARSTERFVNYWLAKTGRDATKRDWERTWHNWLLKDQEDAERRGPARLSPTDRALATIALGQEPQRAVSA